MGISSIIFLCVTVVVLFLIIHFISRKKKGAEDKPAEEEVDDGDFSRVFFVRSGNGETPQLFLEVGSQGDCAVIQSMLHSSGIPSYAEHIQANSFYGPTANVSLMLGINIKLSIIAADYDAAFDLVREFRNNKVGADVPPIPETITEPYQTAGLIIFPQS